MQFLLPPADGGVRPDKFSRNLPLLLLLLLLLLFLLLLLLSGGKDNGSRGGASFSRSPPAPILWETGQGRAGLSCVAAGGWGGCHMTQGAGPRPEEEECWGKGAV